MRDPDSAAHALGKLFKYVGEDNVLWGTDSIWYGSPQDQIQAFRTFQIADGARGSGYGYPKMTPALRAKVFGRNALKIYKVSADVLKVAPAAGQGDAGPARVPRARGPDVPDARTEDAARVPESPRVGRRVALRRIRTRALRRRRIIRPSPASTRAIEPGSGITAIAA